MVREAGYECCEETLDWVSGQVVATNLYLRLLGRNMHDCEKDDDYSSQDGHQSYAARSHASLGRMLITRAVLTEHEFPSVEHFVVT